jgi:lipopolysaccharide biosynthesis regulator YciM
MTTILERLRTNRQGVDYSTAGLMEEAAREIERLLDECDALRQANQYLGVYTPSADWPDDA